MLLSSHTLNFESRLEAHMRKQQTLKFIVSGVFKYSLVLWSGIEPPAQGFSVPHRLYSYGLIR